VLPDGGLFYLETEIVAKGEIKKLPDVEYLNECFDYDTDTGMLTWKYRPRHHFPNSNTYLSFKQFAGRQVTHTNNKGYYCVVMAGKNYLAHRVIWKILHGLDPEGGIDHKDGNPLNNKPDNLRMATQSQNMGNTAARRSNGTGFRNVHLDNDRGTYRIRVYDKNRKKIIYRRCVTLERAIEIAKELNYLVYGEFSGYKRGE
jgi:hypothetical protein